jgi:hypothetical protein
LVYSLAFARMPRVEARGGMATGDRGVARRAKTGGFGGVPLGFATDAPRGSAGSFTIFVSVLLAERRPFAAILPE